MIRRPLPFALPLGLLVAASASACSSPPLRADATVLIHGGAGPELGVNTERGVLFLGRSQSSGVVGYTAFFGDGPSLERGEILPVTPDLYRIEPDIRLPLARIGFVDLRDGDTVRIQGHHGPDLWEASAKVRRHPATSGLLLAPDGRLRDLDNRDTGAAVYAEADEGYVLVGLIAGRIWLPTPDGEREYVAVAGPETLAAVISLPLPREPKPIPETRSDAR